MRKTLQKRHSWTDEELNILSYLRYTRHWRFKKIQTSYFPSLSPNALLGAYWRLSTEDRIRRASRITTSIIAPRRPNRPSIFHPRKPEYLVDRRRFPHFFRSYKYSLNLQGVPDSDYTPPSRMPTPSSSDRSVSIVSSLPSAASSLELFGLEVRSPQSSNSESVTSDRPNDISSPEFFSSEEHPLPT